MDQGVCQSLAQSLMQRGVVNAICAFQLKRHFNTLRNPAAVGRSFPSVSRALENYDKDAPFGAGKKHFQGGEEGAADGIDRLFGILHCVCAGAYAGGTVCKCYAVGRYDLCAGFQHKFGFGVGRNGEGHIRLDGVLFPAQGVAT